MSVNQHSAPSFKAQVAQTWNGRWPLERSLFLIAGTVVLVSVLLAVVVSPWFLLLTGFVGINQLVYAGFGFCGVSLVLTRFTRARPASANGATR